MSEKKPQRADPPRFDTAMPRKLVVRLAAWLSLLILFAMGLIGYYGYQTNANLILTGLQNQLQLAANTIAISIDGDIYQNLRGRASVGTPDYAVIKKKLEKFLGKILNNYLLF